MKVVVSAILFALVGIGIFLGSQKLPVVKQFSQCYKTAILATDDAHIFTRRAHTTDEAICTERKASLKIALTCVVNVEMAFEGSLKEAQLYKKLARYVTRSPQTIEEMVDKHNLECSGSKVRLDFDPVTNQWY